MGDGSRSSKKAISELKAEWNLFWDGLFQESNLEIEENTKKEKDLARIEALTLDEIKEISKELSKERKKLHQQMEHLNKEIELSTAKIESLNLVGGNTSETSARLSELNDQGEELARQMSQVNKRIEWARQREADLKSNERDLSLHT
jgi:chromosome segregation ATPase